MSYKLIFNCLQKGFHKFKVLSQVYDNKLITFVVLIFMMFLGVPTVVYAVNLIVGSGEFVGLGETDGRLFFTENGDVDNITFLDSNVGINLSSPSGQRLHIGDGNILIEGAGETAVKIKRDVTYTSTVSGVSQNPIFEFGRITQAGDGDPEVRFFYSDDNTTEGTVFEFDRKGIVASVKTERGSHFEGFISRTDPEPIFRLNSYPSMRLEMGEGGNAPVDVAIQRETTNTITFLANETEEAKIDPNGIEVSDGYLKLDTSSGTPPNDDCDHADEIGRMKVDATSAVLYVCTVSGWGKVFLPTNETFLPAVQTP